MAEQTAFEREVALMIVEVLNLDGVQAGEIDPDTSLFREGLGLDSIDVLELALAISQRYGIHIRADDQDNGRVFASLGALSEHIERNKQS